MGASAGHWMRSSSSNAFGASLSVCPLYWNRHFFTLVPKGRKQYFFSHNLQVIGKSIIEVHFIEKHFLKYRRRNGPWDWAAEALPLAPLGIRSCPLRSVCWDDQRDRNGRELQFYFSFFKKVNFITGLMLGSTGANGLQAFSENNNNNKNNKLFRVVRSTSSILLVYAAPSVPPSENIQELWTYFLY